MQTTAENELNSLEELFEKCFSVAKDWNYFIYRFEDIMEFFGNRGWDRLKLVTESEKLFIKVRDYPDLFDESGEERLYEFHDLIIGNGLDNNIRLPNEPDFPEWKTFMKLELWRKGL
ncbi:hypothetical protein [Emticicia sp. 17c]|uniref:hypothetical protein n=1 Tax=Emticicia sp. 17c TaxID=3127704 RepID=UPI00301E4094